MYLFEMQDEHDDDKIFSFIRCLFLKRIDQANVVDRLITIVEIHFSSFCYFHLLQNDEAIDDVAFDVIVFDCRNWNFVCVIIDVWFRDQDDIEIAQFVVRWIYNVVENLLFLNNEIYDVDFKSNFKNVALIVKIFESNRSRLIRFKYNLNSRNVLIYACSFSKTSMKQKFIIFVTSENCVDKNYCVDVWIFVFIKYIRKNFTARAININDAIKRKYAMIIDFDLNRLRWNRVYKM